MTPNDTPQLDARNNQAFVAEFLARLPGYVPGWYPAEGQPSWAIIQAYARYLRALAERLNLAPDKNKMAFLEMLGINLIPAQASRAPIVFKAMPQVGDGRIPIRTQVGATVAGLDEPLIFETEQAIALASAQLAEVITLWPGKDAYADHSQAALGGQPFTLFEPLQPVPHELYLAHNTYFALSGQATVELQVELTRPGSQALSIIWEYWDGEVWRMFKSFQSVTEASQNDSVDGTEGLTRSGLIRLVADCAETAVRVIDGIASYWVRGRITTALPPDSTRQDALIRRLSIRTSTEQLLDPSIPLESDPELTPERLLELMGKTPEHAFADALQLDVSRTFFPFGPAPQAGSTFYLSSEEIFSKPGATVRLRLGERNLSSYIDAEPDVAWEYWDGAGWRALTNWQVWQNEQWIPFTLLFGQSIPEGTPKPDFTQVEALFEFYVPEQGVFPREINGQNGRWLRVTIISGNYTKTQKVSFKDTNGETKHFTITETLPPQVGYMRLSYAYSSPRSFPDCCLLYHDFAYEDRTEDVRGNGAGFAAFRSVADRTPTLYLGFDKPLPADLISLYLDIQEVSGRITGPVLKWEYWSGKAWSPLTVQDETAHLVLPGMVAALWPGTRPLPTTEAIQASGTQIEIASAQQAARFQVGDLLVIGPPDQGELVPVAAINRNTITLKRPLSKTQTRVAVSLAALPRFGRPRTWLRARLQSDGEPATITLNGLFLNAVWAAQVRTIENEALGSSDGRANQVFFCRQSPVLVGEVIEVRELSGPRAAVELPILQQELLGQGFATTDIRTVTNRRTGQITEVWVRWLPRPNLFFSGPDDRHYMVERSRGRVIFGDNVNGRIPPAGADNIRAQKYRSGGTVNGNVPAGAITQLLSGVVAEGVSNPRPAEGGADGELLEAARTRGPQVVRHHQQAIALNDYEALAREASPAVAVARALPVTHSSGRSEPGWVKLIIMPHSQEAQPQPSFGLRRQITHFLTARTPAGLGGQLFVTGPDYLPVGVEAAITPRDLNSGGRVLEDVSTALTNFLHPLIGGPEGQGWPFGRDVYLSDVAAVLERVPGVDYVSTLNLLLNGTPRGERVDVPPDRIVVAGDLRLTLSGGE